MMKSILYVHDHQDNPWQKKQLLESAGMQVELAKTSNDCLIAIDKSRPDIVLMDVLLEGSNGFELCEEIRRRFSKTELPRHRLLRHLSRRGVSTRSREGRRQRLLDATI